MKALKSAAAKSLRLNAPENVDTLQKLWRAGYGAENAVRINVAPIPEAGESARPVTFRVSASPSARPA